MSIPQPPIEVELFARQLENILLTSENQILGELQPTIAALIEAVTFEAEGGISDERLDELTTPLNNQIRILLEGGLFTLQEPIRQQASTAGPVTLPAPLLTPQALLQRAVMADASIAEWLRKQSPSRWQTGIMDLIRGGLEQGWSQAITQVTEGVQRLTDVVVSTALWSFAGQQLQLNWQEPEEWLYTAVLDASTCPLCFPWSNVRKKRLSDMPDVPQHPACRCVLYPLFASEGS